MSSLQAAALMLIGIIGAVISLLLYILGIFRGSRTQAFSILAFAISLSIAGYGAFQRFESKNVFSNYFGFGLSSESHVLRYRPEIFSRDPQYCFELSLSVDDAEKISDFIGRTGSSNDAAIERLPSSWNIDRNNNLKTYTNSRRSAWFNFDYDPDRMIGWLVITST